MRWVIGFNEDLPVEYLAVGNGQKRYFLTFLIVLHHSETHMEPKLCREGSENLRKGIDEDKIVELMGWWVVLRKADICIGIRTSFLMGCFSV